MPISFWQRLKQEPLHPAIVHFPLAFLMAVPVLQIWHLRFGDAFSAQSASFLLKAGLAMSLPAMLAGGFDFYRMVLKTGRQDVYNPLTAHVMCMLTALLFYVGSLLCLHLPPVIPLVLSVCGAGIMTAGGWLGGALVYRHRIGMMPEE